MVLIIVIISIDTWPFWILMIFLFQSLDKKWEDKKWTKQNAKELKSDVAQALKSTTILINTFNHLQD